MFVRLPAPQPLANSNARLAIVLRSSRGSRVVELGNGGILALLLLTFVLLAWYLFATLYLIWHDEIAQSLVAGQRQTYYAYENRIAELRTRIDRMTARQLVNQDSIEDRVSGLVARQAELEARQILLSDARERLREAGLAAPIPAPESPSAQAAQGGPLSPRKPAIFEKPQPLPPESPARAFAPTHSPSGFEAPRIRGALDGIVREIDSRAERLEKNQVRSLALLGRSVSEDGDRARRVLQATGLSLQRFGKTAPESGKTEPELGKPAPKAADKTMPVEAPFTLRDVNPGATGSSAIGGPLLPPVPGSLARDFDDQLSQLDQALSRAARFRSIVKKLPIARPLPEQHEQTSGFGTRLDPFTRGLAQHSGLDFRAPTGTPVHAAAAGRIVDAGSNGGYGRMIEIDHGHGIATRYAHLSAIGVREGDYVAKGAVIGLVGSTGRSTGAHLHYEVRIDEEAEDPTRFLQAGRLADIKSE